MVALSPRCCADLGIPLSEEDRARPYVEVSGRKGLGVKADDLMDNLIAKALVEVDARHAEKPVPERQRVAEQIAIGALRYFLLKFTRTSVIAFDLQEALSFEGETGPYLQYSAVRARNILRKLEERGETLPDFAAELSGEALARHSQTYQRGIDRPASWHVLIAKDGVIYESAPFSIGTWHVGKPGLIAGQRFENINLTQVGSLTLTVTSTNAALTNGIFGSRDVTAIAPSSWSVTPIRSRPRSPTPRVCRSTSSRAR